LQYRRKIILFFSFIFLLFLQPVGVYSRTDGSIDSAADNFRKFLQKKGVLADSKKVQISPAVNAYLNSGLSPLPNCGITEAKDNPPIARKNVVNIFSIYYDYPSEKFCAGCANPTPCYLLADNCITIGGSIFCDIRYLERIRLIASTALSYAWSGVSEKKRNNMKKIPLTPIRTNGLMDLAKLQISVQENRSIESLGGLKDLPANFAMRKVGASNLLDLLDMLLMNFVLAHELGHVEQNLCPNIKYIDEKLEKRWTDEYYSILGGSPNNIPKHELEADLRSIEISSQLLEKNLKDIAIMGGGFSNSLSKEMRDEFESLMPIVREVALMALVYFLEYELIVHPDAENGLNILKNEPYPVKDSQEYFEYYVEAGYTSVEYFSKSHIDPCIRALFLIDAIGISKIRNNPDKKVTEAYDWRLAPYIVGRLSRMRKDLHGKSDDNIDIVKYVLGKFGR
jgi:hypothetical protein